MRLYYFTLKLLQLGHNIKWILIDILDLQQLNSWYSKPKQNQQAVLMQSSYFQPPFHHQDLSQIHEALGLQDQFNNLLSRSNSRFTAAQTLISSNNQQTYHQKRMFVLSTLQSWGMKIGILPYSKDNQITLKCLLQLISQRQKDIAYKTKSKQQLNAVNFEKQKYQSLLKQQKNTISEKDKLLGKIQNQSLQLRRKIISIQNRYKKQKAEDQKMVFMLKSKNQQILHEIKKKQAQVSKIKQQMKKSVTSKSVIIASKDHKYDGPNQSVKNSFQLIQRIQKGWNVPKANNSKKTLSQRININQNYPEEFQEEKHNFMLDRHQKQKKVFSDQNALLRSKIFQIRQILVRFAQWIDIQLFGQSLQTAKRFSVKKFICNHNAIFSRNAMIDDLNEVVNQAKNGVQQLQDRLQPQAGTFTSHKSIGSPSKCSKKAFYGNHTEKAIGLEENQMFKKKSTSIRLHQHQNNKSNTFTSKHMNTENMDREPKRKTKPKGTSNNQTSKDQLSCNSKRVEFIGIVGKEQIGLIPMSSQIKSKSSSQFLRQLQLSAFEHDILSEIDQISHIEDQNSSLVSHISVNQLIQQANKVTKGKYDKWDLLFQNRKFEGQQ